MDLKELQDTWDRFGRKDPLWAIISTPEKKGNKWQLDEFFETGVSEIAAVMRFAAGLKLPAHHRKALDFGCGVGRLTQALANHFDEVVGLDIAPSMLRLADKHNQQPARCKYLLNRTSDLRMFADNTFDFIYTNMVLQHMRPDYAKSYIVEFLRVLNPNGLLVFQLPSERVDRPGRPISRIPEAAVKTDTSMLRRIKTLAKQVIPDRLLTFYRDRTSEPTMQMYCVPAEEVEALLHANAARIVDIAADDFAKPLCRGFRYAVTKQ